MRIPKVISKNNREYIFVKKYSNFYMYEDMITHCKECFLLQDLVKTKNNVKISKNIKPEKDRYF